MWLANWLDIIAEQSVHEYKVTPWQIPVQEVHKVIATAQGHFTRFVVGDWIPATLWSTNFHIVTWLRVGFPEDQG